MHAEHTLDVGRSKPAELSTQVRSSDAPVHRVEVWPLHEGDDARSAAVQRAAERAGLAGVRARVARVYLVQANLGKDELARLMDGLLVDPVLERGVLGASPVEAGWSCVEVHPLPGVMDPAAQSVAESMRDVFGGGGSVLTGVRYDMKGVGGEAAARFVEQALANRVVHGVHIGPMWPASLPSGSARPFALTRVPMLRLDDAGLAELSRRGHLFLSVEEMRAIQAHFRSIGRDPTDIELETLAQTWSEHCVHKTLKSTVLYQTTSGAAVGPAAIDFRGRPGCTINADGSVTIANLLRSTVAAATHELIADGIDWALSVFKDNSGVVALDDEFGVCIKVETHNRPSAIEPYGGSATGIGGCIRDVIGTGLGARPIASTDVFCVAFPEIAMRGSGSEHPAWASQEVPAGCLQPRRILSEVVAGVRDYGNRMGIPTINGAVYFDQRHVGNPLVFCGCVGLIPRRLVKGGARAGDLIVALGGRTGRDGIHGATFSSAEVTDTHADEFSHAVQIGNAIEEKRLLDAILRAQGAGRGGEPLFSAITDCGAGGFSSAIGEMGSELGATVELERAPLKYAGLTYTEIWISEAQERMILAVPSANLEHLQRICDEERVELAVLGVFGTAGQELVLRFEGAEVGRLPMALLHDGIPMPTRRALWSPTKIAPTHRSASIGAGPSGATEMLRALLAHPNIASKHWIIRQYDHEVQGSSVVKPMVGPMLRGPGDASVVEPIPGSGRGIALACGLQTGVGDTDAGGDPYEMALAAIDECVRNLVCVGADPSRIAILDNFCWPGVQDEAAMGALVRACVGCYDGAKAYRTPFVSGKDSLNNQFVTQEGRVIRIPPTLLITGLGIVHDVSRCVTMDAKRAGNVLALVGLPDDRMGGSHAFRIDRAIAASTAVPRVDLSVGPARARRVAGLIERGLVRSIHDVSDGGLLCAVAEMVIAGSTPTKPIGAKLELDAVMASASIGPVPCAFAETPSLYVLEIEAGALDACRSALGAELTLIGALDGSGELRWDAAGVRERVEELAQIWRRPLDW